MGEVKLDLLIRKRVTPTKGSLNCAVSVVGMFTVYCAEYRIDSTAIMLYDSNDDYIALLNPQHFNVKEEVI